MDRRPAQRDYFVIVSREAKQASFCWKIERRGEAMGVNLTGCGFSAYRAAEIAGRKALEKLLLGSYEEENRSA